jgi:hypothetical protein
MTLKDDLYEIAKEVLKALALGFWQLLKILYERLRNHP